MRNLYTYSHCEAIADIVQIATRENFRLPDSREQIALYIEWAEQFETLHKNIEWGVNSPCNYIDAVEFFTVFKINCHIQT